MQRFISHSYSETLDFAAEFAKGLKKGAVVAYLGDLGAGKTAFTKGLAKGLGINAEVTSPTFAICNEYHSDENTLYHFDMYRIGSWEDLYSTAFFDFLETDAYMAVEWSENIFGALPDDAVVVELSKLSENEREIKICTKGEYE